jgi:putative DNA primase/helicase
LSIDTTALKQGADIVSVIGAYTRLKKIGVEYCGPCPIHGGDGDNFYVNPRKGIWRCFSRGCDECDEGNDVIGFLRRVDNLTFQEACEKLGAVDNWQPKAPIKERAKKLPERVTSVPPADAGEPVMELRDLGAPARVWTYRDVGGAPIMYVARYDTRDGKQIRCFSWGGRPGEESAWHCMHFNRGQRPLYNLDQIIAKPLAPVLIVEGEKAADAAAVLLPQYVVTTWPGGAQAWKLADLSPLKGRRVDLWPDADKPGRDAMDRLAAILADPRGLGCNGKLVGTEGLAEGFDAADWSGDDIIGWLKPRAKPYAASEAAPPPPPPPPEDPPNDDSEDEESTDLPAEMSEDFIAERFAEMYGDRWRYVKMWGSWFEWRKDGWYKDDKALIDRLAVEMTRKALWWPEAKQLSPGARLRLNSRRTAGAIRDTAMSHRKIAAATDQWDCDPWLLGVTGGVVNLRDGKQRDSRPDDYMTKRCSVAPENGEPRLWLEFLKRVTDGDGDLVAYLQRFAGYALTGMTSEHALAFLYGTGANGKTTFLQTLMGIYGDYAVSAGFEVFADSKSDRHPTEIARLRGARLVVTEETDAGGRWNEGRIKRLTGGGKISAHFMRQDDFEFEPQFKLLIAGNHKPMIKSVDEAIKRRIHLVPFTVTIPQEERDKQLMSKLEAEWPQILRWAIEGCLAWQEYSLSPGERIIAATEQYVESEDILGAWLEECCDRDGDWDGKALYDNYRKWCEAQGENCWSRRAWSNAMLDRGFTQKRNSVSRRFQGVSLKAQQQHQGYEVP